MYDSHAHLTDEKFTDDLEQVLEQAWQHGLVGIVNVGYDLASSRAAVALAERDQRLYAAAGLHPHDAKQYSTELKAELQALVQDPKVVAVGEAGLDYHYNYSSPAEQRRAFAAQLELAQEVDKPLIVHSREATEDTLALVGQYPQVRVVMHCFSGSWETAQAYLAMGHYISLAGPVTFKNASKLRKVAEHVPLDRLLIETDCPYLAPVPVRGKRNQPGNVRFVAEAIARIKKKPLEQVIAQTAANTVSFFRI